MTRQPLVPLVVLGLAFSVLSTLCEAAGEDSSGRGPWRYGASIVHQVSTGQAAQQIDNARAPR
jgi:hypothetical protein